MSVAVIVNPRKVGDPSRARALVDDVAAAVGQPPPLWFETTAADPGPGQARRAMEQGATTVVAWGGDGTVMGVAATLVNSDASLGIVPGGTGNLLARNLGIPLDARRAIEVALTGAGPPDRPARRVPRPRPAGAERRHVRDGLGRRHDGGARGAQATGRVGCLRPAGCPAHAAAADAAARVRRRRTRGADVRAHRPHRERGHAGGGGEPDPRGPRRRRPPRRAHHRPVLAGGLDADVGRRSSAAGAPKTIPRARTCADATWS